MSGASRPVESGAKSRIFTVPAGHAFLDCLADAVLAGDLPEPGGTKPRPLDLPAMTLLMPTRRACRSLQEAFLARCRGRALLLPRISPIAEGEEDLSLLSGLAGQFGAGADIEDTAAAVTTLERRLVLTQLVMKWSEASRGGHGDDDAGMLPPIAPTQTPAQAAHLALGLATLMDEVETEGASFAALASLVDAKYSEHWQLTLDFLQIVTSWWPAYLKERGLASPMARRDALIRAEARRLAVSPPHGPVIVAGVTGSVPATAALMAVVARLPQGAIVLPGLDLTLDAAGWEAIAPAKRDLPQHPEHPQYGLKMLLDTLGVARGEVRQLQPQAPTNPLLPRTALIAEAMRPAGATAHWRHYIAAADRGALAQALAGLTYLETPTAQDEAETIALIMREVAEHPARSAALVSPDRLLARRVAVRLEAWGIKVDDSAGRPFAKTTPGAFLDLIVEAVAGRFAPPDLMALLKHPLTRLGRPAGAIRRAARALELLAFRTTYLGEGLDGVATALDRAIGSLEGLGRPHRAVRRLWSEDHAAAQSLLTALTVAFAPLMRLAEGGDVASLDTFAAAHFAVAETLAREESGSCDALLRDEAGEAASALFTTLLDPTLPALTLTFADYPDFYRALIQGISVRPRVAVHPRLFIWGPLEARLQKTDVMILGGLNDGTWPEPADPGPWLNRPMRAALGLPSPEAKIGFAAHDFTTFLGAQTVYLTRAAKIGGVPTVPSRWLMRLQALLKGVGLAQALWPAEHQPWLAWARMRDEPGRKPAPIKAPAPCPPLAARPRKMSVTQIEHWMANPYAIYARHILKLDALPALGPEPDAALRGQILHESLARFTSTYAKTLPPDPAAALIAIATGVLADYAAHPRVAAFWQPRLARFATWFADTEADRRREVERVLTEVRGSLQIALPAGAFQLTARADRLDLSAAGLTIFDYKTGTPPNDTRVLSGEAPQLPLEAAIAAAGGFENIPAGGILALKYIRASGGEPPGEERAIKVADVGLLAAEVLAKLSRLIREFDDVATPYKATRRARFSYDYDEYAHLARVAEWQVARGED